MGQMEAAIAYLKDQDVLNYAAVAKLFDVKPTTLRMRFLGISTSRAAAHAEHYQLLNTAQEEMLLSYINKITARHIPPTV
jgi:hypothetical protein